MSWEEKRKLVEMAFDGDKLGVYVYKEGKYWFYRIRARSLGRGVDEFDRLPEAESSKSSYVSYYREPVRLESRFPLDTLLPEA